MRIIRNILAVIGAAAMLTGVLLLVAGFLVKPNAPTHVKFYACVAVVEAASTLVQNESETFEDLLDTGERLYTNKQQKEGLEIFKISLDAFLELSTKKRIQKLKLCKDILAQGIKASR